jgi:hypothetical protein
MTEFNPMPKNYREKKDIKVDPYIKKCAEDPNYAPAACGCAIRRYRKKHKITGRVKKP